MNTKFKESLNKTQEISLAQFKQIWAIGGWDSGTQQFSNTESWDYLWAEIASKVQHKAELVLRRSEIHAKATFDTGAFGIGEFIVEPELSKADIEIAAELCCYNTGITNVTNLGGKHLSLNELPEDWTEVYLKFNRYKQSKKRTVLVARNNHDGTVQLYSVK